MFEKVKGFIKEYGMIDIGDKIVAGISGGADSICLLKVLIMLRKELKIEILGVHVNHGIRGEEALRDENFVRAVCEKYNVKLFVYNFDIPELARQEGTTEEETGRIYRYKAFYETLEKEMADKIAVAHNMNDNSETVLQRFLRGTGVKGLGGIEPVRGRIIRPLLCVKREEIENFLGNGEYITDSTNLTEEYTRNKIRLQLMPMLKREFNPNIVEGLWRMSLVVRREDGFLERMAADALGRAVMSKSDREIVLSIDGLKAADGALTGRVLRQAVLPFTKKGQDIDFKHIKDIEGLIYGKNGRRINLIEGICAAREFDVLRIGFFDDIEEYCYNVEIGKEVYIKEAGIRLLLSHERLEGRSVSGVIWGEVALPVFARKVKNGDRLGIKGGRQEIKKVFSEKRIALGQRGKYPVIEDGNGILAVAGLKSRYCETGGAELFVYLY